MNPRRVSVIVPAWNEAKNLTWVLPRIDADYEVVLVDGGSTDGTVDIARSLRPDVVVVTQSAPGKGSALARGMLAATGDIIVMIDADGSMDPAEIPAFVGLIDAGADLVKGSRYLPGAGSEDITRIRSWGNKGLTITSNILFGTRWSELCYGFAAFRRDALNDIGLADIAAGRFTGRLPRLFGRYLGGSRRVTYGHGFEIEALLFTRAARHGLRVCEVASYERDRIHGESNLTAIKDGTRVLLCLLWERRPSVWRQRRRYHFPDREVLGEVS